MEGMIFIKPAVQGHVIRHPEKMQHLISQDGEWVVDSVIWQRKLIQGDVVLAEPPVEVKLEVKPESKSAAKQKSNKEGDE